MQGNEDKEKSLMNIILELGIIKRFIKGVLCYGETESRFCTFHLFKLKIGKLERSTEEVLLTANIIPSTRTQTIIKKELLQIFLFL